MADAHGRCDRMPGPATTRGIQSHTLETVLLLRHRPPGRHRGDRGRLVAAIRYARRGKTVRLVAGWVLLLNFLVWQAQLLMRGKWELADSLPLHLCDAAAGAAMLALLRPTPLLFELTWYWGMSGAALALFSPDIRNGFPDYDYFQFFVIHAGSSSAPSTSPSASTGRPRRGGVWRALHRDQSRRDPRLLREHPLRRQLLLPRSPSARRQPPRPDGPWPWYIVGAQLLTLLLFALLSLARPPNQTPTFPTNPLKRPPCRRPWGERKTEGPHERGHGIVKSMLEHTSEKSQDNGSEQVKNRTVLQMVRDDEASMMEVVGFLRSHSRLAHRVLREAAALRQEGRIPVARLDYAVSLLGLRRVGELAFNLDAQLASTSPGQFTTSSRPLRA